MNEWILPALGTFFLWGLWGLLPKITVRYMSPMSAMVYEAAGGILVAVLALIFLKFNVETNPKGAMMAAITSFIGFLGALCYLYAVSKGPVTLVASFTATYPLVSIILAKVVLDEAVSPKQGLGILMALGGMVLVAT